MLDKLIRKVIFNQVVVEIGPQVSPAKSGTLATQSFHQIDASQLCDHKMQLTKAYLGS